MTLLIKNARVLTMGWPGAKRGKAMGDIGVLAHADVLIDAGRIAKVIPHDGTGTTPISTDTEILHAEGHVLMPAFVDCHTHAVFGGERANEFEQRLEGATYEQIARAGGGIAATVRATRAASEDELLAAALPRARDLVRSGATTIEVKSGYGLELDSERRMLRAARLAGATDEIAATARTAARTAAQDAQAVREQAQSAAQQVQATVQWMVDNLK